MNSIVSIKTAKRYRRSIMIVDDQRTSRLILQTVISKADKRAHIMPARDADEALALASSRTIDIVFTDYQLGAINGIDLIRQLRAMANCAATHYFAVTASDDATVRHALRVAGALNVFSKPIVPKDIEDLLCKV